MFENKVQVASDVGDGLSCKKDVPGSCLTVSNVLARLDDMSRSLEPESCSAVIGDSREGRIACLAGCITCGGDLELSSLLEIVMAFSLGRICSLGSVTCWWLEFSGNHSTVCSMSLSLIAEGRNTLLRAS